MVITMPPLNSVRSAHSATALPVAPAENGTSADLVPPHAPLEDVRRAARGCKACDLWKSGTQTVFGEGSPNATIMRVGEQPGDQEDRKGHPFVGPAGRILDE